MSPFVAAGVLWLAWGASWLAASAWSRRTQARPSLPAELPYRILTVIGFVLIFARGRYGGGTARLWPQPPLAFQWALVALAAAGFAFCWWARLYLGALWSSTVTRKQDHRIVATGPYRLVRHPIYTGLIAAALATGALTATSASMAGVVLFTLGCWMKARLEERFLRAELGAADYDAYARKTGMLLPFL